MYAIRSYYDVLKGEAGVLAGQEEGSVAGDDVASFPAFGCQVLGFDVVDRADVLHDLVQSHGGLLQVIVFQDVPGHLHGDRLSQDTRRITSYNVCYTKLLRLNLAWDALPSVAF